MSDSLEQATIAQPTDSTQAVNQSLASDAYNPAEGNTKALTTDLTSKDQSTADKLFGALHIFASSSDASTDSKSGSGGANAEIKAPTQDVTQIKSPDGSVVEGVGPITVEHKWDWSHPLDSAWYKLTDKSPEPPEKNEKVPEATTEAPKDPAAEKARLTTLADDKLKDSPDKLKEFKDNMEKVEHRQPPLSPDEKAALFSQESRLLEAKGDKPTTEANRQQLAEEIMRKSADPTDIHQGYHGTCQVATVESRMYYRDPSKAAKLVADMAIDGQTTLPDGKVLKMDAGQLKPDNEVTKPNQNFANRDYSGQIFQEAAVNTYLLEHGYKGKDMSLYPAKITDVEYKPGEVEYRQVKPTKENPTGEQLVDVRDPENPREIKYTNPGPPGVNAKDLPELYGLLSHKPNDSMPTLENTAYETDVKDGKDVVHVKSEADLQRLVKEAKDQGKLPIFVAVDTNNQPFRDDAGDKAGGTGGSHAVLITDIHENPPPKGTTIDVQNPWGADKNHFGDRSMPIHQLWTAMGTAGDIAMNNMSADLKNACGTFGNDNDKIFNTLENKTPEQIQRLAQYWSEHNPQSLEKFLETEMKRHPEELKRALKALKDGGVKLEHPELAG